MKIKSVTSLPQREIENTFPKLLIRNNNLWGDEVVALRKKERGVWRQFTWKECYEQVRSIFRGLLALGLSPGDRVAIIGDSNPEWFWSELAIQAARGTIIAINPAASTEKIKYIIKHSKPKLVMAQDQEQIDKLYATFKKFPFERLIYWRDKGLRHYKNPELISLKEMINEGLIELSKLSESGHPAHFEQTLVLGNGSDPAIILYTVGESEEPEEVVLSHEFLIVSAESVLVLNPVTVADEYVSLMSPGWFFEQALGYAATLLTGQRLNFAENVETALKDFREISPDTLVYPSHLWHRLKNTIESNIENTSRIKRILFEWLLGPGHTIATQAAQGGYPNILQRALYFIANYLAYRPLRDKHGLDNVRIAYSAGETLSEEDVSFFRAFGIEIKNLYASTDRGIVTLQPQQTYLDKQLI